jgi:hypothetical protein
LYFAADPFCRTCIGRARRAWTARIADGVAGVVLTMALLTGVMLAAIPSHVRARVAAIPVRHVQNCRPFDQWLAEARRDLAQARPHNALHDLALSRRDCPYDAERDRIEALAYARLGDKFAAIAALARYRDAFVDADDDTRRTLDDVQAAVVRALGGIGTEVGFSASQVGDFPTPRRAASK